MNDRRDVSVVISLTMIDEFGDLQKLVIRFSGITSPYIFLNYFYIILAARPVPCKPTTAEELREADPSSFRVTSSPRLQHHALAN